MASMEGNEPDMQAQTSFHEQTSFPDNAGFPEPRSFEPTDAQLRYNSLARHVILSKARSARRSHRLKTAEVISIGAIIAVVILTIASILLNASQSEAEPAIPAGSYSTALGNGQISTPRSEWTRGSAPYLYQTDAQWKDQPYADGTISTHGCGPTCLSAAYIQLTGSADRDPSAMAEFSEQSGFIDEGVTSWLLMSEGAEMLGLHSREMPPDPDAVRESLLDGNPIICSVSPGDFTTTGHFIVLCGLDDSGNLLIRDPNSPERSQQTWDIDRVLGQCRNLWELSL